MSLENKEKADNLVEIEIGGEKYSFSGGLTGWDFINACSPAIREGMKAQARMAARASYKPKLSMKDIFDLPVGQCQKFLNEFAKASGLEEDFLE